MVFKNKPLNCSNVQGYYAKYLKFFTRSGMILLGLTFGLYIFQIIPSSIPLDNLPGLLTKRAGEYVSEAGIATGWGWVNHLMESDYLSLMSVVFLASVSLFVYIILIPVFVHCRDRVYLVIVLIQILVFILAASGVVSGGH